MIKHTKMSNISKINEVSIILVDKINRLNAKKKEEILGIGQQIPIVFSIITNIFENYRYR